MSEMHDETTGGSESTGDESVNGTGGAKRRNEIVVSSVADGVITFKFTNDEVVTCDVKTLPEAVKFVHLVEGVRNAGRLSFQKLDDPAKAATALREKLGRLSRGEIGRTGHVTKHEPTALTQALAEITGKDVEFIENTFYPNYFSSTDSGCTLVTVKGKQRVYGKQAALDKLMVDAGIKPVLDKIMKERAAKMPRPVPGKKLDVGALVTASPQAAAE